MPLDHAPIATNEAEACRMLLDQLEAEIPAGLLDQWEAEVDAAMGLDDADLLQRVSNLADPLHVLLVEELAARYEDVASHR